MKTLVVEDDTITRLLFVRTLERRSHEVTACADAETALEAFQREAYPLVLLDWMLGGMDGLQLCRRLREHPRGRDTVILVLTARDKADDLRAVLEAGADDYVAKPVDQNLLNVRLTIAEQRVLQQAARRQAEDRLAEARLELQKSHDDLRSILNQLRTGTALTDRAGHVTFLSQAAARLLGVDPTGDLNLTWRQLFPLDVSALAQLQQMAERPAGKRENVPAHIDRGDGSHHRVDIEVQDDPRDPRRKIFVLYDVSEVYDLRQRLDEKFQQNGLVGRSEPILRIFQQLRDIAAVDYTVLIEGETGTGKELVARAIHSSSPRRDKPFIAVNCAGLTDSLLTSQLFGHKRGAFTGAISDHVGLFEAANGGTIFLDEIGDIPMPVQTSLLRVLQEREITRVGESRPRKIDVRVITATHRNLPHEVQNGTFRADLLYRIRVTRLNLPPLRERREDIALLVGFFLSATRATTGKKVYEVSPEAMSMLRAYEWPGNVRELRSAIEASVVRCRGTIIQPDDLPPEVKERAPDRGPRRDPAAEEKQRFLAALEQARGSRTEAARLLGVSRATFYRHLTRLGLNPEEQPG